MNSWQLQEAKGRFSEVVDITLHEGPQLVTRRGHEAVVILAATEYRRITGQDASLVSTLLHAPRGEPLDIVRSCERPRDILL